MVSRAIHIRRKYIEEIATMEPGEEYDIVQAYYLETLYLIIYFRAAIVYEDKKLQDWFCEETDMKDWASVCAFYDISQEFVDSKFWSNKKIRYTKTAYEKMTFDYKPHKQNL